jgi:hypothetical protein
MFNKGAFVGKKKFWRYRLYIYDKIVSFNQAVFELFVLLYGIQYCNDAAHFEMLEGQTNIICQWYEPDVWEIHMKEVV